MADLLKMTFQGMAKGLKDSVLGAFKIYQLDNEKEDVQIKKTEHRPEQMSVLARKRAERLKSTESKPESRPRVLHRIFLCCAWNGGVFWLSIILFNGILLPCLQYITHFIFGDASTHSMFWSWIGPTLSWTFGALWILPLFVLSKAVNALWFQDIADAAYRKARGHPLLPGLSKMIADVLFSVLVQSLFLIQAMLAYQLPLRALAEVVYLLHMCLLYSLYAFEYKWFNMGWEVHKRLSYIESNWPYFVGFGLPLALLTAMPSSYITSGCFFSILFPLFIISGNEADAIEETCDFPLRLFSMVISISNSVFHHSLKKSSSKVSRQTSAPSTPSKHRKTQRTS